MYLFLQYLNKAINKLTTLINYNNVDNNIDKNKDQFEYLDNIV